MERDASCASHHSVRLHVHTRTGMKFRSTTGACVSQPNPFLSPLQYPVCLKDLLFQFKGKGWGTSKGLEDQKSKNQASASCRSREENGTHADVCPDDCSQAVRSCWMTLRSSRRRSAAPLRRSALEIRIASPV